MYHPLSKFLRHVSRGDDLLIRLEEVLFNSAPEARKEVRGEAIDSRGSYLHIVMKLSHQPKQISLCVCVCVCVRACFPSVVTSLR